MSLANHALGFTCLLAIVFGPIPLCLWVVSRTRAHQFGPAAHFLLLLLVWCLALTSVSLLLGAAGHLALAPAMAALAALFALGFAACWRAGLTSVAPIRAIFASGAPLDLLQRALLAALLPLGALLLWRIVSDPITEFDSLAYHLPNMARWYQTGAFDRLEQFPLVLYYPFDWEALCGLFILPFGDDFLVALPNLVAWAMLGLGVYTLSRLFGASRTTALGAAALLLAVPLLIDSVNSIRVDIAVAASFVAAVVFALCYARTGALSFLGLSLASAGMLVGTKASGFMYCALLAAILVPSHFVARGASHRRTVSDIAIGHGAAAAGAFVGVFWYAMNFVEVGNPFGQVAFGFGHLIEFAGPYPLAYLRRGSLASVFDPSSYLDWTGFAGAVWKQGSYSLLCISALAFLCVVALLGSRHSVGQAPSPTARRSISPSRLWGALALAAVTGYLYVITPYGGSLTGSFAEFHAFLNPDFAGQAIRYAFPYLGALAVAAAVGATAVRVPPIALAAVAVAVVIARVIASGGGWALLICAAAGAYLVGSRAMARRVGEKARSLIRIAAVAAAGLVIFQSSLGARAARDRAKSAAYGPIYDYVSTRIRRDETIGYAYYGRSYPLYGRNLDRRVIYIPLQPGDAAKWLTFIRARKLDIVSIGPIGKHSVAVETVDWIKNSGLPLDFIFGRNLARQPFLYRVKKAQARPASATPRP